MTGLGCVFNKDVSEKGCEIPSKFKKKKKDLEITLTKIREGSKGVRTPF